MEEVMALEPAQRGAALFFNSEKGKCILSAGTYNGRGMGGYFSVNKRSLGVYKTLVVNEKALEKLVFEDEKPGNPTSTLILTLTPTLIEQGQGQDFSPWPLPNTTHSKRSC
jgi:hypothetical protein